MNKLQDTGLLVARILMPILFIVAGYGKMGDAYAGTQQYMQAMGVPGFFLPLTILLVNTFRKVSVEDQCGQNGETGSEQRGGASQETKQNGQTAAKFQQDSQWRLHCLSGCRPWWFQYRPPVG